MRVLVDTNIFLDDLLSREQFGIDAKALFEAIESQKSEGYVTATTVTDIFYIVRKQKGLQIAKQAVSDILAGMKVCTVDRSILETAIASNLPDARRCNSVSLCNFRESGRNYHPRYSRLYWCYLGDFVNR